MQLWKHIISIITFPLTYTRSDPLHLPAYVRSPFAVELYIHHFGLIGNAAALVCADAAVCRAVLLNAGTTRQRELLFFTGLEFRSAGFTSWHLSMNEERKKLIPFMVMILGSKIEHWKSSSFIHFILKYLHIFHFFNILNI